VLQEKKDVYKPPAFIHHDNTNVSLLQKKAWSWLIANAYDELPTEEIHNVNVADLMRVMDYNSHDQEHLKDALRGLMGTIIEWDIPRYDKKKVWQAATMLAEVRIEDSICYYSFGAMFRQALYHPEIYARLSLHIINQFSGKYALNLWEMCVHAINPKTGIGETQWWEIDEFRRMIGVKEGTYKGDFYELNKRVIKPSIKEIELLARCKVTPEYKRKGRKYTHIKFKAARIKAIEADTEQGDLFIDTEGLPDIIAMLVKIGVHRNKAMKVWSDGFRGVKNRPKGGQDFGDYVQEKIDLLQQEVAKGRADDPPAWLIAAIRDNYQHQDYQKRKHSAEIQKRITQLETETKRLEREMGRRDAEILEPLFANDEILQNAFENAKQDSVFKHEWNSYAGNIRAGMEESEWFKATLRIRIKEQHIENFNELDKYQERMQEVEAEIDKLKASLRG